MKLDVAEIPILRTIRAKSLDIGTFFVFAYKSNCLYQVQSKGERSIQAFRYQTLVGNRFMIIGINNEELVYLVSSLSITFSTNK
jgi:hypothetical protein